MIPADYSTHYVMAELTMTRLRSLLADRKWMEAEQACIDIMADVDKVRLDAESRKAMAVANRSQATTSADVPIALVPGQY